MVARKMDYTHCLVLTTNLENIINSTQVWLYVENNPEIKRMFLKINKNTSLVQPRSIWCTRNRVKIGITGCACGQEYPWCTFIYNRRWTCRVPVWYCKTVHVYNIVWRSLGAVCWWAAICRRAVHVELKIKTI